MNFPPRRRFTQEEYLVLEDKAELRSQFVAGELFTMNGEEPWHCQVTGNILGVLHGLLRRRDAHVYTGGIRVRVKAAELCAYPDISALAGEPVFEHLPTSATLLNPQVIFEVLSPETEVFDRGDKFNRYRMLDSLTDYVTVASELARVEPWSRRGGHGGWLLREYRSAEDRITLASLDCALTLAEIYEDVMFPELVVSGLYVGEGRELVNPVVRRVYPPQTGDAKPVGKA